MDKIEPTVCVKTTKELNICIEYYSNPDRVQSHTTFDIASTLIGAFNEILELKEESDKASNAPREPWLVCNEVARRDIRHDIMRRNATYRETGDVEDLPLADRELTQALDAIKYLEEKSELRE